MITSTTVDFREITGDFCRFHFLSYSLRAQVVWGHYNQFNQCTSFQWEIHPKLAIDLHQVWSPPKWVPLHKVLLKLTFDSLEVNKNRAPKSPGFFIGAQNNSTYMGEISP